MMQDKNPTPPPVPPEYVELQLHRERILAPYDPDDPRLTARKVNGFVACLQGEAKAARIRAKLAQPVESA